MANPFVMLVDDESDFIETMSKRLQKRGFKVLTATEGKGALELVGKNRNLEVMILDVKMPGMDGIEVLREMKKSYPLIEVIMLTGHATIESAIDGMKIGAFDYLMKPCNIEQLSQKVQEAVEKRRAQEEKIEKARMEKVVSTRGI
ncbi:DNA-binding NtrC family response regulator [Desulfosalsimonas propionicica]|uniref:DNA-binding NtrC family response regulator n=1 Tax=Desulfosalsimonas propionicica TaxID=332175 RepID=A0A7W0C790_9BACT|nr:response regulator [Desulfosalsimonas propionicica]MBA2880330.1 DNA-binding NtrC family response regulator [Desulfosalsimonas propionicica]